MKVLLHTILLHDRSRAAASSIQVRYQLVSTYPSDVFDCQKDVNLFVVHNIGGLFEWWRSMKRGLDSFDRSLFLSTITGVGRKAWKRSKGLSGSLSGCILESNFR